MTDQPPPSDARRKSSSGPGMGFFIGGAGTLVGLGLVLCVFWIFKIEPPTKAIFSGAIVALLAVLNMAFGFILELTWAIRERRFRGIVIQLATTAILSGILLSARSYLAGEPIEGDAFVPLLGKHRDDPQVRAVFARLGHDHSSSKDEESWGRHAIEVNYTKDGRIKRIVLGSMGKYGGDLPGGIKLGKRQGLAAEKLGVAALPLGKNEGVLEVPEKGLVIGIREGRAYSAYLTDKDLFLK
jgi:hypothetical protein